MPELTGPDQEVVLMCSEGYSSALSADPRSGSSVCATWRTWRAGSQRGRRPASLDQPRSLPTPPGLNHGGQQAQPESGTVPRQDNRAVGRRSLAGEHGDPVSTGVQSVERALGILRALSTGPARVTDIATRTRLPKSTVSRLLSTLEGLDAVEQDGAGGPYRLGPLVLEIAGRWVRRGRCPTSPGPSCSSCPS